MTFQIKYDLIEKINELEENSNKMIDYDDIQNIINYEKSKIVNLLSSENYDFKDNIDFVLKIKKESNSYIRKIYLTKNCLKLLCWKNCMPSLNK